MILPMFSHPCSDGYVFQWGNTDQFRHSESIIRKHRSRGHDRRSPPFPATTDYYTTSNYHKTRVGCNKVANYSQCSVIYF